MCSFNYQAVFTVRIVKLPAKQTTPIYLSASSSVLLGLDFVQDDHTNDWYFSPQNLSHKNSDLEGT